MTNVTYDPVDTVKPFADGVWIVDSGPLHGLVPVRMTVLRLPDGGLLLHSPTRYAIPLRAELAALGPVRAIVAPNTVHWMYAKDWQDVFPDAVTYGAPGLGRRAQVKRAGFRVDAELSETPPAAWGGAIELVRVPGGFGFVEMAFFHKPSRTLVVTDLILNFELACMPAWSRPLIWAAGSAAPGGRAAAHVRVLFKLGGRAAREGARRLVALLPERVVMSHGTPFTADAAAVLARSLRWLT